jgi:hypothetical protein
MLFLLVAAFAADTGLVGGYAGEWKSGSSGNGGPIRFVLENTGGAWKSTASFSLDGTEVPCTMRTVKIADNKIELVYEFEVQGTVLRSTQKGEWKDGEFHGTYETATADGQGIDAGTWSAKRKP